MEEGDLFGWIRVDRGLVAVTAENNGETSMIDHDLAHKNLSRAAALLLAAVSILPGCVIMARQQTDQPLSAEMLDPVVTAKPFRHVVGV